jgi:2-dehydro-3-deoxygluconokinase
MLRLKSPGFERLFQSPMLEATFGGGEANVAVSLAGLGLTTSFVSAIPANPVGDAAARFLNSHGVDTSQVLRRGDRLGVYYLEAGANQRSSNVIYDRENSAINTAQAEDFDWEGIFEGAGWFHITGITPALSASAADLALAAVREARARGLTVSCDFSYRQKLWQYGKAPPEVMGELVGFVDVVMANAADCRLCLGITIDDEELAHADRNRALAEKMFAGYSNLKYHTLTQREGFSASHHGWSAALYNITELLNSRRYEITDIVDRVGGGDAFAAGLIYGLHTGMTDSDALEFAVAASCLKHSVMGDANLVTVEEVQRLMGGDASGRVRR